jgi:hypothetical protein
MNESSEMSMFETQGDCPNNTSHQAWQVTLKTTSRYATVVDNDAGVLEFLCSKQTMARSWSSYWILCTNKEVTIPLSLADLSCAGRVIDIYCGRRG